MPPCEPSESSSERTNRYSEPSESSSERTHRHGRVVDFDEHVGLGHVQTEDGQELLFHCVEIADGTRTIPVGQDVEFDLLRKFGRDEASNVRPPT